MEEAMNDTELNLEKRHLTDTVGLIDSEMADLDKRLTGGIEAADAQTVEALTRQFIGRLKVLLLIKDKPYFARVDFTPADSVSERLYIGKSTVLDDGGDVKVVDWRAPVSTLYYEGRVGQAGYSCPEGDVSGEISLKRQYEIEDRRLLEYRDIDITFDEELLRPYLAVESSMRLKNIIATIQSEQNRIIRAGMLRPLIVQGVAGSGKTTVALHRIAYLIYTYAASIRPEEFLIIAPNALFLDYISGVLPDLGVENVRQNTYESLVQQLIGKKLKIEDPGDKLARILSGQSPEEEVQASRYKSSLGFRDAVDAYLDGLQKDVLPKEDFKAGKYLLCPYQTLAGMFEKDYAGLCFAKRISLIKERLTKLIGERANRIIAEVDAGRRHSLSELPQDLPREEYKARKREIYGRDEGLVSDLLSGGKEVLKAYLKKIRLPSAIECYHRLLSDPETLRRYAGAGITDDVLSLIVSRAAQLSKSRVEYEDLAPLTHIQYRIQGVGAKISVRHVVIDEAQDFSLFQFFAVREALGCGSFTVFGDLAQGIYQYRGTADWNDVAQNIFDGSCDMVTLQKSYRSTVEIMEQANRVLSKIPDFARAARAVPVIRNGEPVRYISKDGDAEIADCIARRIEELRGKGTKNIAVVCKTMRDCENFARHIKKYFTDFQVIGGRGYAGGLSIVPSYLVKGLEFDAVMIADAHRYQENERDIKLLYVAMTRAMHCMDVCYVGEQPSLLR